MAGWTGRARAAALVGVAVAYVAAGKLGLSLALVHPSASAVWPPTGVALAAFLVCGRFIWPAILVGAFVVNATTEGNAATSLAIAVGNTLEGAVGALLVERFANGSAAFERPRDVFRFLALAGLVATALSATIGVTSLCVAGFAPWDLYPGIWLTWWMGDAGGAVVVAPALVLWARAPRLDRRPRRLAEAAALLVVSAAVGALAFEGISPFGGGQRTLSFVCLPVAVWAAFRFGPRETASVALLLSGIAVHGTVRGAGYAPGLRENEALLLLQLFMGVVSATSLSLAAVVAELRRSLAALASQAAELSRSNAALDEFAHVVSHDLKAPLRGISSLADWIRRDCAELLPPESREHLALLEERAQRLRRMVDGVLAWARAGRRPAPFGTVDARVVVDEVVDSLGPLGGVRVRVEGPLPELRYDRTHLSQVFQNLIHNAVEHRGRPSGEIVVSCRERAEDFEFSVSDDGVGLGGAEASGTGLAIVRGIVALHGGAVAAESEPGRGATFRFTVPKRTGA